jgi:glycosyltransferase involved in cell wall biosynthesis
MRILWTSPHCRPDWIEKLGQESQGGQTEVMLKQTKALVEKQPNLKIDIYTRYQDNDFQIDAANPLFIGKEVIHQPENKFHLKELENGKIRVIRLPAGPPEMYIKKEHFYGRYLDQFVDRIKNFIKKNKLEYKIAHGHYADGWETVTKLSLSAKKSGKILPTVLTTHSLGRRKKADCLIRKEAPPAKLEEVYNFTARILSEERSLDHADKICPLSTTEKEFLEKEYDAVREDDPRLVVTPNGINPNDFKKADKKDVIKLKKDLNIDDKFIILVPSRVDPRKGQLTLVKALSKLDKSFIKQNNLVLLLIAWPEVETEYTSEINNFIKLEKLEEYVVKRPSIPHQDMPIYFGSADLVVIPSQEYFSIAMIEAMLLEKMLIASNEGGSRDAIVDGQSGFLVDHNDPHQIGQAVKTAVDLSEKQKNNIGLKARQRIIENYTLGAVAERILELYSSVSGKIQ